MVSCINMLASTTCNYKKSLMSTLKMFCPPGFSKVLSMPMKLLGVSEHPCGQNKSWHFANTTSFEINRSINPVYFVTLPYDFPHMLPYKCYVVQHFHNKISIRTEVLTFYSLIITQFYTMCSTIALCIRFCVDNETTCSGTDLQQ